MNSKIGFLLAVVMIVCSASVLHAQDNADPFVAVVDVDSLFARALPSRDADFVASLFEDQQLEVVGRNIDGTWFEVRRPGRFANLGWVLAEMLDWEFAPEYLPLTDLITGVEGPAVLTADPGFAVYMQTGAMLRSGPLAQSDRLGSVPRGATVPVLGRNQDGSWLKVNYIGYEGWIVAFAGRDLPYVMDIPEAPDLPPLLTLEVVIIPPEVQLAQIRRLREFITPWRDLSLALQYFWQSVQRGTIMPCDPPPEVTQYQFNPGDVRELPELNRYAPQLNDAVDYLIAALAPLEDCGVVTSSDVRVAHAAAINATLLFNVILDNLDTLEALILE